MADESDKSEPNKPVAAIPTPMPALKPKGLIDLVAEGTRGALDGLERGMTRGYLEANAALATPEGADLAPLIIATDLPELPSDGPLGQMGLRLDREADLHRNVAVREFARVAWMERLTLLLVVASVVGEMLVAAAATLSALTGSVEGRAGLFALAAIILAMGAGGASVIFARSRVSHRELANDALARARGLEERLFRLSLVMEWRVASQDLFQDALARLERDASPSSSSPSS